MVALPHDRERKFSVQEYLRIERAADFKSEYYCGRIYAMAGASPRHTLITANVIAVLHRLIEGSGCRVYSNDLRVRSTPEGLYTYPDATVICGSLMFHKGTDDVVTNPTVVIEVLSPSTETYDRGLKADEYRSIDSLNAYVLIWQDRAQVEVQLRTPANSWLSTTIAGLDNSAAIEPLNCSISATEIYAGVEFGTPVSGEEDRDGNAAQ